MIERSSSDGITTLRLAHGKASALDLELVEALTVAFAEETKSDSRAVLLTGSGSIFSAGVDLFRLVNDGADYALRFVQAMTAMYLDMFSFPKPLVVFVNGHAIAGGCIFTLCADYRVMAPGNGRIGMPELLVGVPFPAAVLEIVRYSVPLQHRQSLIYTGRTIVADEALRTGVVDELSDLARAEEMARHLASLPARAFALTKHQHRDPFIRKAKHFAHELDDEMAELWSDAQTHEHIREYLAKTVKKG